MQHIAFLLLIILILVVKAKSQRAAQLSKNKKTRQKFKPQAILHNVVLCEQPILSGINEMFSAVT
jgi:hypothetical protein